MKFKANFLSYLIFIQNLNFLEKSLKFVFKAFFSDQAFWDFLDACSTFSAVGIKFFLTKFLSCLEKEYDKKSQFMT